MLRHVLPALSVFLAAAFPASALEVKQGDRICIIGNTFAERMQHSGYFETLLNARFGAKEIAVRNLAWSADTLNLRPRPQDCPSPDQWLTAQKATVILASFGLNESYEMTEAQFRTELEKFIDHTLAQKYDGKAAPRLVLIAPLPMENTARPGLPNADQRNTALFPFINAMKQVCAAKRVECSDIGAKVREAAAGERLTTNGIHLNEKGEQTAALALDTALFGKPPPEAGSWTHEKLELLRTAVNEKNYWFFHRYRPVNPFYVYGGRAKPYGVVSFPPEMEYLEGMVANRDRKIWDIATGKSSDLKVDDSTLKPLPEYKTELKGDPDLLSPEDEQKTFKLLDGFEVNLFASEVQFPELAKPTQLTFDSEGRMWLCTIPSYPHMIPGHKPDDKIVVLTDKDSDGKADECKVFADGLYIPTGIELGYGGAFVAQQPDLMFLKDTDGNGTADTRERVLHGFGCEDSHHSINAFCWGPGGGLYMMEGTFLHSQIETPWGPTRLENAGVYRYDPRTERLDVHVTYNYANPWGETWDKWGRNFIADASGGDNHFGNAYSGWLPYPEKHTHMDRFTPKEWHLRPTSGCEVVSSRQFPDEFQGWWLLNNVIGFQGTRMFRLQDEGSGFKAVEYKDLIQSAHRNFRPVDLEFGPDGALYIVDWYNPIVGHMQYSLRDPSRDKAHGRIWRVTAKGRKPLEPAKFASAKPDELMELLRTPEDRTRYRVRRELAARATIDVLGAVERFVRKVKDDDSDKERLLLEALWVQQHHDAVQQDLLKRVLASAEPKARAAAVQVLRAWRERIPGAETLLKAAASDEYPAVRLEAVVAASNIHSIAGVEIALEAAKRPLDYYLDYALKETIHALDPWLKEAAKTGKGFAQDNPAGQAWVLAGFTNSELLNLPKSLPVQREMLRREGIAPAALTEAVKALAGKDQSAVQVILDALPQARGSGLTSLLAAWDAKELAAAAKSLTKLAADSKNDDTRRAALAALVAADGGEAAWSLVKDDPAGLMALCQALPLVASSQARGSVGDRIGALLDKVPEPLAAKVAQSNVPSGRYVRVELPRRGTLSLTEVEVVSGRKNIAPDGKASQSSTAFGGVASRAIDTNTHGEWGRGTTTHTEIDDANPWWEVDLGSPQPISQVALTNRNDPGSDLGKRLDGFRLTILDPERRPVFTYDHGPAGARVSVPVSADAAGNLRSALVRAFASMPGRETEKITKLLPLLAAPATRSAVITALKDADLTKADAAALSAAADTLAAQLPAAPLAERLDASFTDSLALAKNLAAKIPGAEKLNAVIAKEAPVALELKADALQLIYDRKELTAPAGAVIALTFENPGEQPHNVVICAPGSLEKAGAAADAMMADPNGLARGFVPAIPEVLHKTRMLSRGEKETLIFRAPDKPGDYVLLCTFPSHWRLMQGVLRLK